MGFILTQRAPHLMRAFSDPSVGNGRPIRVRTSCIRSNAPGENGIMRMSHDPTPYRPESPERPRDREK
jgi:hypothetical protein